VLSAYARVRVFVPTSAPARFPRIRSPLCQIKPEDTRLGNSAGATASAAAEFPRFYALRPSCPVSSGLVRIVLDVEQAWSSVPYAVPPKGH
jgi:hypothetical protein